MQLLLEGMCNNIEYALKDSEKLAGRSEVCSDSNLIQSVLNGSTFKYHFWGGRFHMLPQSYIFSHGLCLDNFLQVWFIVKQIYKVPPFRYINWANKVAHLVKISKVLGDMKP